MGSKNLKRSQIALNNSLFTVSLYDKEKLIGFGRVVGDGGITYVVSDIMVDTEYQRRGFAEQIMKAIDRYFEENTHDDSYICLIANHPADLLYLSINLSTYQKTDAECCEIKKKRLKLLILSFESLVMSQMCR